MSTPVSLNLLNKLGKRDKMRGLDPNCLRLFRNKFNKFNNTGAQIDSIYHMTSKLRKYCIFVGKCQDFAIFYATL